MAQSLAVAGEQKIGNREKVQGPLLFLGLLQCTMIHSQRPVVGALALSPKRTDD
jgi:hypothetical protein